MGKGGYSNVFAAIIDESNHPVAVKTVSLIYVNWYQVKKHNLYQNEVKVLEYIKDN